VEKTFEKLNEYFGANAYSSSSIQFNLPSVESFAKRYVTPYEIKKAKEILDAHYKFLRSDLVYEFTETTHVYLETKHRTFITCNIEGFENLRELQKDWIVTLSLETIQNELKAEGKDQLGDTLKILYAKQLIQDEVKDALEIIDRIETFIDLRINDIRKIIEPLLT
jgi:hypothetical protein